MALAGPFAVAVLLLFAGGITKVVRPEPAAAVLLALGVRVPRPTAAVRMMAVAEALVAAGALVSGARVLALTVMACYVAFALVVALGRFRPQRLASCGCFGTADSPPTVVHLVLDLVAAAVAGAVAASPFGGIGAVLAAQPLLGLPFSAFVAMGGWLCYLTLSAPNPQIASGDLR